MSTITSIACKRRKWTSLVQIIYHSSNLKFLDLCLTLKEGGGAVLPYNRVMWMCRWMESHFHVWIDYNGVAFSIELIEWGSTFSDFLG